MASRPPRLSLFQATAPQHVTLSSIPAPLSLLVDPPHSGRSPLRSGLSAPSPHAPPTPIPFRLADLPLSVLRIAPSLLRLDSDMIPSSIICTLSLDARVIALSNHASLSSTKNTIVPHDSGHFKLPPTPCHPTFDFLPSLIVFFSSALPAPRLLSTTVSLCPRVLRIFYVWCTSSVSPLSTQSFQLPKSPPLSKYYCLTFPILDAPLPHPYSHFHSSPFPIRIPTPSLIAIVALFRPPDFHTFPARISHFTLVPAATVIVVTMPFLFLPFLDTGIAVLLLLPLHMPSFTSCHRSAFPHAPNHFPLARPTFSMYLMHHSLSMKALVVSCVYTW
ncbi:hypothetical protein R3P38DRAFT_3279585 [Favolaschia claudopus]|uniref:Uncharacterized protein n=1 Tax=Favolaschia claudopus TaxID=2862362 RepID=A0AAW0AHU0_9AGAR